MDKYKYEVTTTEVVSEINSNGVFISTYKKEIIEASWIKVTDSAIIFDDFKTGDRLTIAIFSIQNIISVKRLQEVKDGSN